MISFRLLIICLFVGSLISCEEDVVIKPNAQLRLDYPKAEYEEFETNFPYRFVKNKIATVELKKNYNMNLLYSKMKATLFLSYQNVTTNNLDSLFRDAQKLAFDHAIKAESIPEQPFVNPDNKVYGMFYMINGNAATQAEFYVTDSIRHFVTGALYFEAKPNFDSLYPAVIYLRKDIRKIMETMQWNDNN